METRKKAIKEEKGDDRKDGDEREMNAREQTTRSDLERRRKRS